MSFRRCLAPHQKRHAVWAVVLLAAGVSFGYFWKTVPLAVDVDVVCAFDSRLPSLTENDLKEIFAEATRVLRVKMGDDTAFRFKYDGKTIPVDELFNETDYHEDPFYRYGAQYQYSLNSDPSFDRDKPLIIQFLENWALKDLAGFFPGKGINSYDDVFSELVPVYKEKVKALKGIRLKDGSLLLDPDGKPSQSYVHWLGMMHAQDKYDVLMTNNLVVYDLYVSPYPHSVCKHAKAAGGSFQSPRRKTLEGMSLAVNILEIYGDVPELNYGNAGVSRSLKNKVLGGFLFAHEFAHAYYYIPDVYDHGDACVMNSSLENLSHVKGYELLMSDRKACRKCRPYVEAKRDVLRGHSARRAEKYDDAGNFYLSAAEKTPMKIARNRNEYIVMLCDKALECFYRAENKEGVKRARELQVSLH